MYSDGYKSIHEYSIAELKFLVEFFNAQLIGYKHIFDMLYDDNPAKFKWSDYLDLILDFRDCCQQALEKNLKGEN